MTYFDHIKGGVPLPDPEKCDKPCKDQDGKEEEGTVGEKVLGNRLPKEGKRQPGYNTRHHTTIQHALHNRFFSPALPTRSSLLSSNSSRASCTRWQIVRLQNSQTRLCEISPGKQTLSSCAQMRYRIWQQEFIKFSTIYFLYIFKYLCSASNKNQESRFDHSDLIHFLLHQSKSCFHIWRERRFGFILENRFLNKL